MNQFLTEEGAEWVQTEAVCERDGQSIDIDYYIPPPKADRL